MSKYIIQGKNNLSGEVNISGAKNAALKIIPAAILASSPSKIIDVPAIKDIEKIEEIIRNLGASVVVENDTVTIDPTTINSTTLDHDLTKKLRGSIVLVGPMLAKFGEVTFAQPGGCLIGARPIDTHLDIFSQFGINISEEGDIYKLVGKPVASHIVLSEMSVTATENAIMTAVFAKGKTVIEVAAAEPEIGDLIDYLNNMGAKISGAGSHTLEIEGVDKLTGVEHQIIPDRIEAGTYLFAAIATNSEIKINNVRPEHMSLVIKKLRSSGAIFDIEYSENKAGFITKKHAELKGVSIDTRTYPGFPTDLQSQYAALMTNASGPTRIFETLFESRFGYINELKKLGANITIEGPHIINIYGPTPLIGNKIESVDIRGGAALVIAALQATGTTEIEGIELIERGYDKMDTILKNLGANIEKVD